MNELTNVLGRYGVIIGVCVLALAVLAGGRYIAPRLADRAPRDDGKRGRVAVWTVTMTAATLLGSVIVLTQIGFYEDNLADNTPVDWLPWLNLAYVTPIAVETVAWVFTVMVFFSVINGLNSAPFERLMWLASSISAGVNGWHNLQRGDWLTGIVLGGMSIAVPLMVHYALRWDRGVQAGLTAEQVRAALTGRIRRIAQVLRHPVNSWSAMSYATNLGCSWDTAYRIALTGQYDAVHAVLVDQIRRSMPPVRAIEVEDKRGLIGRVLGRAQKPRTEVVHEPIENVHAPVHDEPGEDIFPACTDPLVADLGLLDDTSALFAKWGSSDPVHEGRERRHTSGSDVAQEPVHGVDNRSAQADEPVHDGDVHKSSDDRAQGAPRRRARRRKPRAWKSDERRARRSDKDGAREVVHARSERQDETAARFYLAARRRGVDISALTRAQVVERIGINNTTAVTRGFAKAESGEFVDPGEQPDEHEWFGGEQ